MSRAPARRLYTVALRWAKKDGRGNPIMCAPRPDEGDKGSAGKVAYATEGDAASAAADFARMLNRDDRCAQWPYRCHRGNHWHLSRRAPR
jgi:hypothetical protein